MAVDLVDVPGLAAVDVVVADRIDRVAIGRILLELVEHGPVLLVAIGGLNLDRSKALAIQRRADAIDDPVAVGAVLVLCGCDPVDFHPALRASYFEKSYEPIGCVLREPPADPARVAPRQAVQNHARITVAGLSHQPEFVSAGLGVRQLVASDGM